MPYRDEIFNTFTAILREKIPERGKLTNTLVDILMIEKEAIYRRLRGEVPFLFSEIAAIAKILNISLDNIIIDNSEKCRPLQLKMVDYMNPEEVDYNILEHLLHGLQTLKGKSNTEVGGALNIIPQSLCLNYNYIYKFYLFKWKYQAGGDPMITYYKDIQPSTRLLRLNEEIVKEARGATYSFFIWDKRVFQNLVDDILYFASIHLITQEEVVLLKKELLLFLEEMEQIAITGSYPNGNRIYFYVSSITFETSISYIESPNYHLTMIKSFTLNDATTSDPKIFDRMKMWMQSLKRTSTLISESGEMQRVHFFEEQRSIINTL